MQGRALPRRALCALGILRCAQDDRQRGNQDDSPGSRPRGVVAGDARLPQGEGERRGGGGYERDGPELPQEFRTMEETGGRVERRKSERDDEGEGEPDPGVVDRERVSAELHQIEDRRRDADAVLDPEGRRRQADEDGEVDRRAAERPEDEEDDVRRPEDEPEPPRRPDDRDEAG